jgi:hypothetical protein
MRLTMESRFECIGESGSTSWDGIPLQPPVKQLCPRRLFCSGFGQARSDSASDSAQRRIGGQPSGLVSESLTSSPPVVVRLTPQNLLDQFLPQPQDNKTHLTCTQLSVAKLLCNVRS